MAVSDAVANQNTNSETLMDAFPALHRAAKKNAESKAMLFALLHYWMTFKEKRSASRTPNRVRVELFLDHAREHASTKEERDALEVITADWGHFGPAEYLLGCT
jgi:hypothetical protein